MKAIYSPYNDDAFNTYLLHIIKDRLKKRSLIFECNYVIEYKNGITEFTADDIIKSIKRNGCVIFFSNQAYINHVVYDLSQRFWYDELSIVNNLIHKIYLEYRRSYDQSATQQ